MSSMAILQCSLSLSYQHHYVNSHFQIVMAEVDLSVISKVIAETKKSFQDSGMDHDTLVKLEMIWKKKLILLAAAEGEEQGQEDVGDDDEGQGDVEEEEEEAELQPVRVQICQLDGNAESSEEEDDDDDQEDDDDSDSDLDTDEEDALDDIGEDMGPPCSDDDVSDEEIGMSAGDLFDTENVIVCQYDKISRNRNKWKFNLKVSTAL